MIFNKRYLFVYILIIILIIIIYFFYDKIKFNINKLFTNTNDLQKDLSIVVDKYNKIADKINSDYFTDGNDPDNPTFRDKFNTTLGGVQTLTMQAMLALDKLRNYRLFGSSPILGELSPQEQQIYNMPLFRNQYSSEFEYPEQFEEEEEEEEEEDKVKKEYFRLRYKY
jgi:hypothetical protein